MDSLKEQCARMVRADRVRARTPADINARIDRDAEIRIAWFAGRTPAEIDARLHELDEEWDIERALETKASLLAMTGAIFGAGSGKELLPVLRRLGVRTRAEIEHEMHALRALRDYLAYENAFENQRLAEMA